MSVYVLHLYPPLKHAKHYIGYSDRVKQRIAHHKGGTGSRFTQVCVEKGIVLIPCLIFKGYTRDQERNLKTQSRIRICERCPVCFILTILFVANLRGIKLYKTQTQ